MKIMYTISLKIITQSTYRPKYKQTIGKRYMSRSCSDPGSTLFGHNNNECRTTMLKTLIKSKYVSLVTLDFTSELNKQTHVKIQWSETVVNSHTGSFGMVDGLAYGIIFYHDTDPHVYYCCKRRIGCLSYV